MSFSKRGNMKEQTEQIYDVLVIGAGITGCMTAYRLARYELKTAVVERGADIASGATGANSAIVHAGFDPKPGTVKAALNARGSAELLEIAARLGVTHRVNGALVMAFDEGDQLAHIRQLYEWGGQNGVSDLHLISGDEVRHIEGEVSDEVRGALWAPRSGIVCPYGLAIAVAEVAAVNGTDFYFEFNVNSIKHSAGVFTVTDGIRTLRARYIVNAAGTHADLIARAAGEEDFPARSLPRRGEYMLLDRSCGKLVGATLFSVPGPLGKGIILSPTADGNLILGPNAHEVDRDDTATTAAGLDEISRAAKRYVRSLDLSRVITQFAGVRPNCVLGDFYLRASEKVPGLVHLAGIESPGLASSPAVARVGVSLLADAGLTLRERADFRDERPPHIELRNLSDDEADALVRRDPAYGRIICRCEQVTEGEIIDAIRRPLGARNIDMVKRRTRAGMGRCQGGFCLPRVAAIIARESGMPLCAVTKRGGDSYLMSGEVRPSGDEVKND